MNLDALKHCWLEEARAAVHHPLEDRTVSEWLSARAADVRQDIRRRLRREAGYYYASAICVALFLFDSMNPTRLALGAGLTVLFVAIPVVLWQSERRLANVPLDRALRVVLVDLMERIDAASRAYLAAYVAMFVCAAGVAVVVAWSRSGLGIVFAGALAAGALAVAWGYASGRAYVRRMFHHDRSELTECLRQLDEAT